MGDAAWSLWNGANGPVRLADILDIALISVLIYLGITWFRTSASRPMILGVLVIGAIYATASVLDMYMTAMLLRVGVTVLLVALVVVFQEELRQACERIADWRSWRGPIAGEGLSRSRDALVEGLAKLSRQHLGALVVLEGRQPLGRHISAGYPLNGEISMPLVCSLFDPNSPGHDGAAIVDGQRISHFGVHLPLSTRHSQVQSLGTRHAAALGLSERCDALIIVISEERGSMSVAEHGQLTPVESPSELRDRLVRFHEDRFRRLSPRNAPRRLGRDLHFKFLSVLLAAGAWLMLVYRTETVQQSFAAPIEYRNLPPHLQLDEPRPEAARVTLTGPERAFNLIDPGSLRISIDLAEVHAGLQDVPITGANVNQPADLSVQHVEPRFVRLNAFQVTTIELPVEATLRGELPVGLELEAVEIAPAHVRVTVDVAGRVRLDRVRTAPVDLSAINRTTSLVRTIVLPEERRYAAAEPAEVSVTVRVRQRQGS